MPKRIFVALIILMTTSYAKPPDPAPIGWTTERPDTRISSAQSGGDVRITVESDSGIGAATLTLPAKPRRVLLVLRLQGLEELRVSYGDITVVGSITSGGDHDVRQAVVHPGGDSGAPRLIGPSSPFWMPMRLVARDPTAAPTVPLADGWVEVELSPDALASGQTTFELRWIDFFRM